MTEAKQLLKKYWKHDSFRKPQEEIINSVLNGNDTLALLPTGGGKSICYQVPGMLLNGITLVVSPLIALIKDQVENLQKRDIKAVALLGGISQEEVSNLLDNCLYGNYKFLYLSPERLQQDWIIERIKQLPINLIAIDEAHCVSQWGHDFRPAYLKIKDLKIHFPKIPFLALTASATQLVQKDIISLLDLKETVTFKKSFYRENIGYHIIETEDKRSKIKSVLTKNPQSSIIYVRNRKACVELSRQLNAMGFSATFFHGGLSIKEKETNRKLWMQNTVQVVVATNAFGMGIDKPDVKTVIHYQLPENLENYYQEVGRAGRNGKKSFGILLTNANEVTLTKKSFNDQELDIAFLKTIYKNLNNFFQIAYGEGFNEQFSFNINSFSHQYKTPIIKTYNALQFLDRQGIITFSTETTEKVKLQFIIPSKEVIRYTSLHRNQEEIITNILRIYTGIFEMETAINPILVAKKSSATEAEVISVLHDLEKNNVISLQIQNTDSKITFNEVREDDKTINRVAKFLEIRNDVKRTKFKSLINYIEDKNHCKSNLILEYFDEKPSENCGICSYCATSQNNNIEHVANQIIKLLATEPLTSLEIESKIKSPNEQFIIALQSLLEKGIIKTDQNNKFYLI